MTRRNFFPSFVMLMGSFWHDGNLLVHFVISFFPHSTCPAIEQPLVFVLGPQGHKPGIISLCSISLCGLFQRPSFNRGKKQILPAGTKRKSKIQALFLRPSQVRPPFRPLTDPLKDFFVTFSKGELSFEENFMSHCQSIFC